MPTPTISKEAIDRMTPEDMKVLADRLEAEDYPTPFASLQDWHLLRAIALQRPELAKPYLHLVDNEEFDES